MERVKKINGEAGGAEARVQTLQSQGRAANPPNPFSLSLYLSLSLSLSQWSVGKFALLREWSPTYALLASTMYGLI